MSDQNDELLRRASEEASTYTVVVKLDKSRHPHFSGMREMLQLLTHTWGLGDKLMWHEDPDGEWVEITAVRQTWRQKGKWEKYAAQFGEVIARPEQDGS